MFEGTLIESGEPVALKRIRINATDKDKETLIRRMNKEALLWRQLRHPFILPFIGIDLEVFKGFPTLVSPWMEGGTLLSYIEKTNPNTDQRLKIAAEVAEAIEYLHNFGLVHGDIRGLNVLVDQKGKPQLADFGLSGVADDLCPATNEAKSAQWCAPELCWPEQFGFPSFKRTRESDVYAFAGLFLEIFTGQPPFYDTKSGNAVERDIIKGIKPATWPVKSVVPIPRSAWDIIDKCWSSAAAERPTIKEVLTVLQDPRTRNSQEW